jgi:4'-phosphopantetheinyl transferase
MPIEHQTAEPTCEALQKGALHLWTVDLDAGLPAEGFRELSPAEQARANAFRFEHLRNRYVAAHVALRRILSRYAGAPPEAVRFGAGPYGKPLLEREPRLAFNLSHAERFAMVALAPAEIGVDIERLRPVPDALAIAARFFHPEEVRLLEAAPAADDAFLRLWTLKEAYLKYFGKGLSQPLNSFSILDPGLRRAYVITEAAAPAGFVASVVYASPPLAHSAFLWGAAYGWP